MKKAHLFFVILTIILFLDQLSKFLARKYLLNNDFVITSFFKFSLRFNTGGVWGFFQDNNLFFIILTLIVVGILIFYRNEFLSSQASAIFYALVFSGALGNFIDRIIFSKVTDFISVGWWPLFNIADSAISIGIIGFLVYSLKK